MNSRLNLKTFFSISLGIHLLLFSTVSILYPEFKIDRLPILNMEISLLQLMVEEKPLKMETQKKERRLQQDDQIEKMIGKKELNSPPPAIVQPIMTNILIEEPKPDPVEDGKPAVENEKSPVIQALNILLPMDSGVTYEEENLSHSLMKEDISKGGNLTIATTQFTISQGNPHQNTPSIEKPQNLAKLQPPAEREILFAHPKYAENPKPLYPQEARKKGYEGEVLLKVEVLANGRVGHVEVKKSSGYEILDRSALTTVKQWKFIPANQGNGAVPCWVNIPIKFQLQ